MATTELRPIRRPWYMQPPGNCSRACVCGHSKDYPCSVCRSHQCPGRT